MTDAWDSMPGSKKAPTGPVEASEITFGAYECHTCYTSVEEATYFPKTKTLRWTCPEGHQSEITVSW